MPIQELLNWVVLGGAVVVAIWNILKAFGKVGSLSKKYQEKVMKETIKQEFPKYFTQYMDEHMESIHVYAENFSNKIVASINERFDNVDKKLESMEKTNSDMVRRELRKIYGKYRDYEKIPQYDYDDCVQLLQDYTGNSYVEDI